MACSSWIRRPEKFQGSTRRLRKCWGVLTGELIGKTLDEIGLLKDCRPDLNLREMLADTGFVFFADVAVECRGGKHIDTEVYLVDRAIQVQCNVRDITRRKQAENELIRRNEELRGTNEQLAAAEEELRTNYDDLFRNQQALDTARRKLNVLNSVTFTDIQNAIFSLSAYLELENQVIGNGKIQQYHDKQIGDCTEYHGIPGSLPASTRTWD